MTEKYTVLPLRFPADQALETPHLTLHASPIVPLCVALSLAIGNAVAAEGGAPAALPDAKSVGNAAQLKRVEVDGSAASDTQMRREFVAGKIVISRRTIDDSGLATVYELLKREPAVTISGDGRLGLLGLPGYTQVLVDGKPAVAGRNPMETDLVHVDRIEIVKGSMAEYGPFGIAGTINIVTKRVDRKPTASLRLSGAMGPSMADAGVAWSETVRPTDSAWSFSNRVSIRRRELDTHEVSSTRVASPGGGPPMLTDLGQEDKSEGLQTISLGSTAAYKFSERSSLTMSPSVIVWRTSLNGKELHGLPVGGDQSPQSIPDALVDASGRLTSLSLPMSVKHETSGGSRLEVELSPSRSFITRRQARLDLETGNRSPGQAVTQETASRNRQSVDFLRINVSPNLIEDHSTKFGVDLGYAENRLDFDPRIDGTPDPAFSRFGTRQRMQGPRHSAFLQDEWTINKQWAATAGVSTEWRRIQIEEGPLEAESSYRITSPSLHLAHKLDASGDKRVRLSLARSFRAPETDQLSQRPTINPLAPCVATAACGANSVEYADAAGNPGLRPERSTGFSASYEHSFGKDSMVSLDGFSRRLRDVIGEVVDLESVPWASVPRYVIRPQNLGTAWIRGISADTRVSLSDLQATWPKVEVRAGATLARSRLETVPGPDNHLADQSPWSAKLGGRYKLTSMPMEVSVDANWTPGRWYRTAVDRRLYQGRRHDVSTQLSWTVSPTMKFRLAANNLFSRDLDRANVFGAGERQDASVWARKDVAPTLTVTVEMKI